jgi:hypothetical protein
MSAEEGAADGESFGDTSSFDEILAMICSDAPTVAEVRTEHKDYGSNLFSSSLVIFCYRV